MNEPINPPSLARPVGFSHAVRAGQTVYLAGQTAMAPDGKISGETIVEQFDLAASNLIEALQGAGGVPDDLVTLQVFVTDVSEYKRSTGASSAASGAGASDGTTRQWGCLA